MLFTFSLPPKFNISIKKKVSIIFTSKLANNFKDALIVPPVASTSSTIITLSCLLIASICISSVSLPYSKSYVSEYVL